jgi:predicted ATPase/DNA-binding SARP family transcriptional activator
VRYRVLRSRCVAPIEFRILGALQALRDGRTLPLGGTKQRGVLALLLLSANQRVSAERLIEELWSGRAPPTAAKSLQMHVARLRQALGETDQTRPAVETMGSGYRLCVAPGTLDCQRFEAAVAEGRRQLAAGDPGGAAHRLRAGLDEWRGPALADLASEPFAQLEINRLNELRVAALEDRIEADLALGGHGAVVAELEALVAVEAYRERLWAQLMLALYRSGRQVEALDAYRRVRARLVEELGIEPGRELRRLHETILTHDPGLDWPEASAVSAGAAALPTSAKRRHNLPAKRTSFVGRAREVQEIEAAVRGSRVVTLAGVGGVGKTRLALEVAERTLDRWPDGVWLVALGSVTEGSAVSEAVGSRLGLAGSPGDQLVDVIADRLEERHLLLVLDNCEHVLDACAELAAKISVGRSPTRLLATSRSPLAVAGERVVRISPLLSPAYDDGGDPAAVDAVRLFLERARDARPEFATGPDELAVIGAICRALDGIPLAIELAASRVRAMGPTEILSRLDSRLSLTGHERDRAARHRTLSATIAWSYDLLDAREREAFRRLAVLPAPFALSAAEHVVEGDVSDAVVGLVDKSILAVVGDAGRTRYLMLETLREFGLQRLAEAGEEGAARRAHLGWAVELVEEAVREAETERRREILQRVRTEYRNLVAAHLVGGLLTQRLRLATGLAVLLGAGTNLREIHRVLGDVVSAAGDLNTAEVRRARLLLGRAMCGRGELDDARRHLADTAERAVAAGDRVLAAAVAADQALVEIKAGCRAGAREFLARSDDLGAASDRQVWSYRLLVEAQMRYIVLGQLGEARRLYEACIALARRHGPTAHLITALAALAELAVDLDDLDTVDACAHEVLRIADPVADAYPRGGAVLALGRAALRAGRPTEAASWLAEGARLDIERDSMATPEMLESLANAVAESGRTHVSAMLLGAASTLRERLGLDPLERERFYIDAALAVVRRDLSEARVQQGVTAGRQLSERDLLSLVRRTAVATPTA